MKRFLLLVLALALVSSSSVYAQGMLRRLGERAKEAVENAKDAAADKAAEAVDAAADKVKGALGK